MELSDSFDTYGTLAGVQLAYQLAGSGLSIVSGRTGNGIRGTIGGSQADNTLRTYALTPVTARSAILGMAVHLSAFPAAETDFLTVLDITGSALLTYRISTLGALKIYKGTSAGTLLFTTSNGFVEVASYRYIETLWDILNSGGTVEVRSTPNDGSSATLSVFTGDTQVGATNQWAQLDWHLYDGRLTMDDLYVRDGNPIGGFLGDSEIVAYDPTAVAYQTGTPSLPLPSSGTLVTAVDETPANGDTDYDYARNLAILMFTMATVSGTTAIHSVQCGGVVRKVSSDYSNTFRFAWDAAGVGSVSGLTQALTTAYRAYRESQKRNPTTLLPWTTSDVNLASMGVHFVGF